MGHQTRPAPRPPRPNRTGQTDDTASAGESPAAKNTLRARRAADLASCQPGLDADQISLYRHHQCLRALQRGTLRARQDFGGVPRTHQFLITLMVHTTKINPATTPTVTSTSSMTNDHRVVAIPRDGQHAAAQYPRSNLPYNKSLNGSAAPCQTQN